MSTICSQLSADIGQNIVIHPFVTVKSFGGPIVIKDGVIIEEKCEIINNSKAPMIIGTHAHIQVGSLIIDSNIGNYCIVQPRCIVSSMNLGDHCIIGAKSCLYGPEDIPENTLYLNGSRFTKDKFISNHKQLEYLHDILPKCHNTYP